MTISQAIPVIGELARLFHAGPQAGGRKSSSYGSREQGRYAADFYTTVKTCYIAP